MNNSFSTKNCANFSRYICLAAALSAVLTASARSEVRRHHHARTAAAAAQSGVQYMLVTPVTVGGSSAASNASTVKPAPAESAPTPAASEPKLRPPYVVQRRIEQNADASAAANMIRMHKKNAAERLADRRTERRGVLRNGITAARHKSLADAAPAPVRATVEPTPELAPTLVIAPQPMKPAAIAPSKRTVVPVKAVPAKVVPAPVKQLSPLEMTRDAALPLDGVQAQPLHDAGRLDVTNQIVRMLGALLLVLALILGSVQLLRRFNLIPQALPKGTVPGNVVRPASANPFLWAAAQTAAPAELGTTNFKVLSSITLPGNSSAVHLVQAADRLLVLGASPTGGVTLITEISSSGTTDSPPRAAAEPARPSSAQSDAEYDDEDLTAFADILREKAGLPSLDSRSDYRALEQVDARLSATQDRLNARMRAESELTVAANLSPVRRRTPKTPAGQVQE